MTGRVKSPLVCHVLGQQAHLHASQECGGKYGHLCGLLSDAVVYKLTCVISHYIIRMDSQQAHLCGLLSDVMVNKFHGWASHYMGWSTNSPVWPVPS